MNVESKYWGLLILLSIIWGASFNLLSYLLRYLDPFHIISVRLILAGCLIQMYLLIIGKFQLTKQLVVAYTPMAIVNNVIPFICIGIAMQTVSSSLAAMFIASASIFTMFLSPFLIRDEPLQRNQVIGIFMGFVGVFFLLNPNEIMTSFVMANKIPEFLLVISSLCYALSAIYGKKISKKMQVEPIVSAGLQTLLAGIIMLPMALLFENTQEQLPHINWKIISIFLALTLFATLFAQIFFYKLLQTIGAVNTEICNLLIPLFATIFGIYFLSEVISWYQWVGISLVSIGFIIVDGRIIDVIAQLFIARTN